MPAPVAKKLSIFFPMWNEEENIERTVDAAGEACAELVEQGHVEDYEIVIVDDASTDSTGRLADELAAADPRIRAVHHERRPEPIRRQHPRHRIGEIVLPGQLDARADTRETRAIQRLTNESDAPLQVRRVDGVYIAGCRHCWRVVWGSHRGRL